MKFLMTIFRMSPGFEAMVADVFSTPPLTALKLGLRSEACCLSDTDIEGDSSEFDFFRLQNNIFESNSSATARLVTELLDMD